MISLADKVSHLIAVCVEDRKSPPSYHDAISTRGQRDPNTHFTNTSDLVLRSVWRQKYGRSSGGRFSAITIASERPREVCCGARVNYDRRTVHCRSRTLNGDVSPNENGVITGAAGIVKGYSSRGALAPKDVGTAERVRKTLFLHDFQNSVSDACYKLAIRGLHSI